MAIFSQRSSACSTLLLSLALTPLSPAQDSTAAATSSDELMNGMITTVDPCAGNPNEAVCRCALEFPPVTYDTSVSLTLLDRDTSPDLLATGRTLMNLIRATVVSIAPSPDADPPVRLYINPPSTPNPGPAFEKLVHTNPAFKDLELVQTLLLPRHLGGQADRLFGSIWWHEPTSSLVVAFRGTQTPFEFHLDTLVGSQRVIKNQKTGATIKVSEGFGTGYLMMRDEILEAITPYASRANTVLVAGHSLGGAIAAVATIDIALGEQFNSVFGMTFGQPRVFDPETASVANGVKALNISPILRVICESDPVPDVPPAAVTGNGAKYQHTRNSVIYFDDPSAASGKGAQWNHHFYYDGYFDDEKTAQFGVTKTRKAPDKS